MGEFVSRTDALRHVRFAGRPTAAVPQPPRRAKSPSSLVRSASSRSSEQPGQFASWILQLAGLAVEGYRGEPLARRLTACLRALHVNTEEQARHILEQKPELLPTAINAMLIGVTGFFRDSPVFEILRTEVLPKLAALHRPLRVWSAGCSSGEELYSVAILLARMGLLEDSFLLGTDCRHGAIEQAKQALYSSHDLRNIEPSPRQQYFEQADKLWRPIGPLRRQVHWKVSDLGRCVEKGPWDLILWRNMAIYLRPPTATAIWQGLASVLAPEGVLVVGKAEQPPVELPLICVRRCVYRAYSSSGGPPPGPQQKPSKQRGRRAPETSV